MLDVRRLLVLVHVVEHGSLSAAADTLSLTPSAVSQQLKRLESEVGQPLLRRRPRGVTPTDAGNVLAQHARKILRQLEAAESDLAALAEGRRGQLIIGAFPTLAASFLPIVLERFMADYPHIQVVVHSARFDELLDQLTRGRLDLCFLWDHPWRPFEAEGLRLQLLFTESFAVLVSKSHHLADAGEVTIADLQEEDWIVRADGHPAVEQLERAAAEAGFRPSIALYANDYQEAQAMVSVGLGVALVPRSGVTLKHPGVNVLSLGTRAPRRRILLAQREERVYSPAETAFVSSVWTALAERDHAGARRATL